jgi:hypothetical protein
MVDSKQIRTLSFHEAIEMGEYQPEYLSAYPEWHTFSQHTKLQYIRKALDNRRHQLLAQWADINTALDFRLKPELQQAIKNIEAQLKDLENDREKLYVEYTA